MTDTYKAQIDLNPSTNNTLDLLKYSMATVNPETPEQCLGDLALALQTIAVMTGCGRDQLMAMLDACTENAERLNEHIEEAMGMGDTTMH